MSISVNGELAIALVREVREEARNLCRAVDAVLAAQGGDSADALAVAQRRAKDRFDANGHDVNEKLEELREALAARPALRDHWGDIETRLQNHWDDAYGEWLRCDGSRASYQAVRDPLAEMVLEGSYVAVPPRLNENLTAVRIGGALDFCAEFKDEVLDDAQSTEILRWIYAHPSAVAGVVDKEKGVVYKASARRVVQALTVLCVLVAACAAVALPFLRGVAGLEEDLVPKIADDATLARAVAWGLAGALVHILVAAVKDERRASREGTDPPTLGNWVLWVHVRYLSVLLAIAGVVFAVLATAQLTGDVEVLTMLAVGYSADSILDLALPKVTSLLNKRTEVVTKAMA